MTMTIRGVARRATMAALFAALPLGAAWAQYEKKDEGITKDQVTVGTTGALSGISV